MCSYVFGKKQVWYSFMWLYTMKNSHSQRPCFFAPAKTSISRLLSSIQNYVWRNLTYNLYPNYGRLISVTVVWETHCRLDWRDILNPTCTWRSHRVVLALGTRATLTAPTAEVVYGWAWPVASVAMVAWLTRWKQNSCCQIYHCLVWFFWVFLDSYE